jgi:hypothetical protein
MARELYYVCRQEPTRWAPRWIVRKGRETYGEYLTEAAAVLDAVEAAQDADGRGDEAYVVVYDPDRGSRIEWSSVAGGPAIPAAVAAKLVEEAASPLTA